MGGSYISLLCSSLRKVRGKWVWGPRWNVQLSGLRPLRVPDLPYERILHEWETLQCV